MQRTKQLSLYIKIFLFFYMIFFISACSVTMEHNTESHIRGSQLTASENDSVAEGIAKENNKSMKWYKENEWSYNRTDKHSTPKICLALSGGGIRSATFSIGVLKGLEEKGVLDKVDIISSVSGGSYAMSWYYVQQYKYGSQFTAENGLFSDSHLNGLSEKSSMYGYTLIGSTFVGNLLMAPVNILLNGVFTGNVNTTSQRGMYENAIRRTFHTSVNEPFLSLNEMVMPTISSNDMNTFIKTKNLPYYIINSTADIDDDRNHYKSKLRNSVFEFTPLRIGSDGFGYSEDTPYTIGQAVSISGAAMDATEVPGRVNSLLSSAFNMDLGFYIENYNEKSQDKRIAKKITPFPFYYLWLEDPHRRDNTAMDIYLTDGGHIENLGAYSLVRRSCDNIIIVDAEYDKEYEFEGYHTLKSALLSELQVNMDVPGLIVKDSNKTKSEKETKEAWKNKADAVETGIIKNLITYNGSGDVAYKDINVTYIKLSINDALVTKDETKAKEFYGEDLVNYYKSSKNNDCGQWIQKCEFPQYTTTDQSYTPKQFKAYIDLGYSIVHNSEKIPNLNN